MKKTSNSLVYPCFNKWIGSIWFIADTHFNDPDIAKIRTISDDKLVNRINSKEGLKQHAEQSGFG